MKKYKTYIRSRREEVLMASFFEDGINIPRVRVVILTSGEALSIGYTSALQ
jgi:hypothetical protein